MTSSSHVLRLLGAAVSLALVAAACQAERPALRSLERAEPASSATTSVSVEPRDPGPVAATSRILVMGTVFWGRWMEEWADASPLEERFPFHRLDEFDRAAYDAWIAGLECPSVTGPDMSAAEQDRLLSFNCEPRFLDEAARWFTALGLANNHTDDRGANGLTQTRRQLTRHGIQHFGDPEPTRHDRACSVVTVPATVRQTENAATDGLLPIALCGYHGVFEVPPARAVRQVARFSGHVPTFAFPHSGLEYVAAPDQIKVDLAHDLVDNGADAVFGDHPHWIQPTDAYRGRLVAYSLGNFMFDQQDDPERTRAASIGVRLEVSDDGHLADWLTLGEACLEQRGDCLDEIRRADLPEMPFTLEYDVVASANPDRVTRPAAPAERRAILGRLGWRDTMAELRGSGGRAR